MALAAAQAAGAPVSIDTIAGWSGMLKAGRWSPLVVTITNAGPAVEAELAVTVTAGSAMLGNDTTRAARMGVQLPARSHRRFSLAMPVSLDMRTAVVTLSAAATATTGVMELGRQELALRDSIVTDRILVAVASELSLDYLAAGDPPTEAAVAAAPVATRLVYPHPEILPDSRAGWDAVDAVVFRDASFNRLRPAQVEALEQWVVAGGTLVISGGVPALDLAAEGMAALCPVEVTGIVERAGLPSLASLVPGPPPRARIVVAASRPRPLTRVLAAEDGIPVVAVRRLGAGSPQSRVSFQGQFHRVAQGKFAGRPAGDLG